MLPDTEICILNPKVMHWTLRLKGHLEMLVIFNIFIPHHIRANVNVEPCEKWEGGMCVVCMHIHYTFEIMSLGITNLSVWIGSGSQMKIVSCGKVSIFNYGFETIILRFIFSLIEQYFIQSAYMRSIHVCFQLKFAFICWERCVYAFVL